MRKFFLYLSLFAMTLVASAQDPTLKARSVYDVNQDDKVTVQDVPALVSKLAGITTTDKTAVDTESLMNVLNGLKSQYDKLVEQYAKIIELLTSHEERFSAVEDKLGIVHHDYVVIGGKKWSTMNLGATTVAGSYATCAGDFYAWGETTPRYTDISWSGTSASFNGWKSGFSSGYNTYPSYTGTTLDAAHDAVTSHADWGEGWRTPTNQDFKDLYAACGGTGSSISGTLPSGSKSTTAKGIYWCSSYDGVVGLLFCDGTNQLFFPASGLVYDTSHYYGGSNGLYWSSSLYTSNTNSAYSLPFYSSRVYPSDFSVRYYGFAVRPVSD